MKTLYMMYAIIFKGVSVARYSDSKTSDLSIDVHWWAHNEPQDPHGGTNGESVKADTPQEAVWLLMLKVRGNNTLKSVHT